jgi:hypothetical protein
MTATSPEQPQVWLTDAFRKAREQQAEYWRARFRLVVNRGITPLDPPQPRRQGKWL